MLDFTRQFYDVALVLLVFCTIPACQNRSNLATIDNVSASPVANVEINSSIEPDVPCTRHVANARTFRARGKTAEAAVEYYKAIERGCDAIVMHWEVAEMYKAYGEFELAINEYHLILYKDSKDIRAHWALAFIYVRDTKNYEQGLSEARLIETLEKKNDLTARRVLDELMGRAYDGLGDYATAVKYYKEYLKECRETPDANVCNEIRNRIIEIDAR